MKKLLTAFLVFLLLVLLGTAAFRYFVTDRIADRGGMENPAYAQSGESISG